MAGDNELKQAEKNLERAVMDLDAARTSERVAEREVEEALEEIREFEEDHLGSHHIKVEIATTAGFYPDGHSDRVPKDQPVAQELKKAAEALKLVDTTGWIASVNKRTINPALSYEANDLKGCVVIDWGPPEGGGGA